MKSILSFAAPLSLLALAAPATGPAHAGAATDGSTGPVQTLSGRFTVPQTLGTLRGANLFHSFARFSIAPNESATFTTTDAGIRHVVSRVTGGEASLLQGPLTLQAAAGSRPDFWFVNPSGITVGAGASFDVPAGLHLATAQQVRFADGSVWSTTAAAGSSLSVAEPQAFGFLAAAAPARLSVDDAGINVPGALTLAGGQVLLRDAFLAAGASGVNVAAAGARDATVAIGGAVSAGLDGDLQVQRGDISANDRGALRLTAGRIAIADSTLATGTESSVDGGSIALRASGDLVLERTAVTADTLSAARAGSISVSAGGTVTGRDAALVSRTAGPGPSGAIAVDAADIVWTLVDTAAAQAVIGTQALDGTGAAGPVALRAAGTVRVTGGAEVSTFTAARGSGGDLSVQARRIEVDAGANLAGGFFTLAVAGSRGQAGAIDLRATDSLSIVNGAQVNSSTFGAGAAGRIAVEAPSIAIDGGASGQPSGIVSLALPGSSGRSAAISVRADRGISIANRGAIASSTFSTGDAGSLQVRAGSIAADGGGRTDGSPTGIRSQAEQGSQGSAGRIVVDVAGELRLAGGAQLSTGTFGPGAAGALQVDAGRVLLDGRGTSGALPTLITSSATTGSRGAAGSVLVRARDSVTVLEGAEIGSNTFGAGAAGSVRIEADSMRLDGGAGLRPTGVSSLAAPGSTGNAGTVSLELRQGLRIERGGLVSSGTVGSGRAGGVQVSARTIEIDGGGRAGTVATGISSQAEPGSTGSAGQVAVTATERLEIADGAQISSGTFGPGAGGSVLVQAASLRLDGRDRDGLATTITSSTADTSTGNAGSVTVRVDGLIEIQGGAEIGSNTSGTGNAGTVVVEAGRMTLDGGRDARGTGVLSASIARNGGQAGSVDVQVGGALAMTRGALIASSTLGGGNAGQVSVRAGSIGLDGGGVAGQFASIDSSALEGSTGQAGQVRVVTDGSLLVTRGASIASNTVGQGSAGEVRVQAGRLLIDPGPTRSPSGISSVAVQGSAGNAGSVSVQVAEDLTIRAFGVISSGTQSRGHAGQVRVEAGSVTLDNRGGADTRAAIDSSAIAGSSGNAGNVTVHTRGALTLIDGGQVSSGTFATGSAGTVVVDAGSILVDGRGNARVRSSISSQSEVGAQGRAGNVVVDARGRIDLVGGGQISSGTLGGGAAGSVTVRAAELAVDGSGAGAGSTGVFSSADTGSSGQTGAVTVDVPGTVSLAAGGTLSIANLARVADPRTSAPTTLTVRAGRLAMADATVIAASSANTDASHLELHVAGRVDLLRSAIETSANDGNGGAIRVAAGERITLADSGITTSVFGTRGNGGNIRIETPALVLRSGFVQANTAAARAQGGDVLVDSPLLVPDGSNVFIGGNRVQRFAAGVAGLNVIQAAAPEGLSGTLDVTLPQLSLSGALAGLSTARIDFGLLGRDACYAGDDSSFTRPGRGALPPLPGQPMRVAP